MIKAICVNVHCFVGAMKTYEEKFLVLFVLFLSFVYIYVFQIKVESSLVLFFTSKNKWQKKILFSDFP